MEIICKIAGIAAAGSALALALKKDNPVFSFALSLALTGSLLLMALSVIEGVISAVSETVQRSGVSSAVFTAVLKSLGISVVTRFASQICSDAGQGAAASAIQLCGAACIIWSAFPLIESVLDMIGGFI